MNIDKAILFKWPGAVYEIKDKRDNALSFVKWQHGTKTTPPTRAEIDSAEAERIAAETPTPVDRATRKKAKEDFLDLLKVPPGQRNEAARALKYLIEDGNTD